MVSWVQKYSKYSSAVKLYVFDFILYCFRWQFIKCDGICCYCKLKIMTCMCVIVYFTRASFCIILIYIFDYLCLITPLKFILNSEVDNNILPNSVPPPLLLMHPSRGVARAYPRGHRAIYLFISLKLLLLSLFTSMDII